MSYAGRPQGTNPVQPIGSQPQSRPQQLGAALQMPAQGGLSGQTMPTGLMPMNPASQASPAVMPIGSSAPPIPQMGQMQPFTPPMLGTLGAGGGGPANYSQQGGPLPMQNMPNLPPMGGMPPGQTPPIMAPGQMPPQPMPPQGMNGDPRGDRPGMGMGQGQLMQQMQNNPNFEAMKQQWLSQHPNVGQGQHQPGQWMQQFQQNHPNFQMPGNFQPGQFRAQMPQFQQQPRPPMPQYQQGQFRQPTLFGMGSRNRIT